MEEFVIEVDIPRNRWGFWIRDYYVTNEYSEVVYTEDLNQKMYTIANIQGCARVPLNTTNNLVLPCIPDEAEFMESQRIGEGPDSLFYDVWKWDVHHIQQKDKAQTRFNAAVFHQNCAPFTEIAWWTAEKFNYTSYVTFLEINIGDGEESPFKQLTRFYECKDYDKMPDSIDARAWAFIEPLYLMQRLGVTVYKPETTETTDAEKGESTDSDKLT